MSQMEKFGESLLLYAKGLDNLVKHYPGQYTKAMAMDIAKTLSADAPEWLWSKVGGNRMAWTQMQDLKDFGVEFDTVFHESHLHNGSAIDVCFQQGQLWEHGINGPICGNCATALEWMIENRSCNLCPMCNGGWRKYEQPWHGMKNPLSHDPALSPDNDFMPEDV